MKLQTPREVMAALGGFQVVAELTGRSYHAAENWNRAEKFPANTFIVMQQALNKRGLKAPISLWGME